MKLIIVKAQNNSGKTHILRLFINEIIEYLGQPHEHINGTLSLNEMGRDCSVIFVIERNTQINIFGHSFTFSRNVNIGICSYGDAPRYYERPYRIIFERQCELIFGACESRGNTIDRIERYAREHNFEVEYIGIERYTNQINEQIEAKYTRFVTELKNRLINYLNSILEESN